MSEIHWLLSFLSFMGLEGVLLTDYEARFNLGTQICQDSDPVVRVLAVCLNKNCFHLCNIKFISIYTPLYMLRLRVTEYHLGNFINHFWIKFCICFVREIK